MPHLMNDRCNKRFIGELTYEEYHTHENISIRAENLVDILKKNFNNPNLGLLKKAFIDALIAKNTKNNHIWSEIHIRTFCGDLYFNASDKKSRMVGMVYQ